MKIIHCCFAAGFTESLAYQENQLAEQNHRDGHEVVVAAAPLKYSDGVLKKTAHGRIVTDDGIVIERLAQPRLLPAAVENKLRVYPEFAALLDSFAPDIIFFHGIASHELLTAARYKRSHPKTLLVADSHTSLANSAQNFVSKNLLHKGYYRSLYIRTRKYLDRLYPIGYDELDYLCTVFGVDSSDAPLLPLGGFPLSASERRDKRLRIRAELDLTEDTIVLLHSGKLNPEKRTIPLLNAFRKVNDPRLRLIIIGSSSGEVMNAISEACADDSRVRYLGWMDSSRLRDHICAADLYVQPGTVASSMQTSLCCGTPVLCRPYTTYTRLLGNRGGAIYAGTDDELTERIHEISGGLVDLDALAEDARCFASEKLNYAVQAGQLYGLRNDLLR